MSTPRTLLSLLSLNLDQSLRRMGHLSVVLVLVVMPVVAFGAQADAQPKTDPEQKIENPLGRLFRGLLKKPPGRLIPKSLPDPESPTIAQEGDPDNAAEEASIRNYRDWIDRCAPHDYHTEKLVSKVRRNLDLSAWKLAIDQLQQILDLPNVRISTRPGQSKLSRDKINQLIASLPQEARESYELQFGVIARQLYLEAVNSGRLSDMADVATRYLNTEAGLDAAESVARVHVDRGEWIAAAKWYQRILRVDPTPDRHPSWFLKAGVAFEHAGLVDSANQMQQRLEGLEAIAAADGESLNPEELWKRLHELSAPHVEQLDQWPQFHGSADRSAVQDGEFPILIPQWELDSTTSASIRDQVNELTRDLRQAGTTVIPTIQPVFVNNKLLVRTLQGVAVIEIERREGQTKFTPTWQTRAGYSPERLMTGVQLPGEQLFSNSTRGERANPIIQRYEGTNPQHHPLTGLLYRDALYGLVSADQKRVYVPEAHAWMSRYQPGYYSTRSTTASRDPLLQDWTTNRIAAYDIDNGRLSWEIGGATYEELFELPLAGHYFLGPPLIHHDRLYIVGEKDNLIKLYCLESATGHPLWETLIGHSVHEPGIDLGRRWWAAQPAISEGILVVPNTTGWLLGVDLSTHAVIWEARHSSPRNSTERRTRNNREQEGLVQNSALNERWHLSAPVILGDRVLHTPREDKKLICTRLVDGQQLWELPKNNLIALVAADRQQFLMVTKTGLQCFRTANAESKWKFQPGEKVTLSGIPAVTQTSVFLPLSDGSLCELAREDGSVIRQQQQPGDSPPLGNLRFVENLLISTGPLKTVAYELTTPFETQLADRMKQNPEDPWGLLQNAQLASLAGQSEEVLSLAIRIDRERLSAHDAEQYRRLLYRSLVELCEEHPGDSKEYLDRLRTLTTSRIEERQVEDLSLDRLIALGHYAAAFELIMESLDGNQYDSLVPQKPGSFVKVRYELKLIERMNFILQNAPSEIRVQLNLRISELARTVDLSNGVSVNKLLNLFPQHPDVEDLRVRVIQSRESDGRIVDAESHYRRLLESQLPEHVTEAAIGLDQLYARFQRHTARRKLRTEFAELFAQTTSDSTGSQTIEDERVPDLSDWGEFSLKRDHRTISYQIVNQYRYRMAGQTMPLLTDYRYDYNNSSQRLIIHSRVNQDAVWTVPLRSSNSLSNRRRGIIESLGHVMFVIQSNSITALSPVEQRVLWVRTLQSPLVTGPSRSYSSYGSTIPAMISTERLQEDEAVPQQRQQALVALTDEILCIRSTRELQAFHPITGELLWVVDKLQQNATIVADESTAYYLSPVEGQPSWKIDLSNGQQSFLETGQVTRLQNAVAVIDGDVIHLSTHSFRTLFLKTRTVIRIERTNLETGEVRWTWENSGDMFISAKNDQILILDTKQNILSELEFASGQTRELANLVGRLPASVREAFVVASNDRIYLVTNSGSARGAARNYYLDSVAINGKLHVIDTMERRALWSQNVENQHLLLELLDDSPVLLFTARRSSQVGNIRRSTQSILVLDQRTGRELFSQTSPYSSDFQVVHLNHSERNISLMSHSFRLLLSAIPLMDEPLQAPRPHSVSVQNASTDATSSPVAQ